MVCLWKDFQEDSDRKVSQKGHVFLLPQNILLASVDEHEVSQDSVRCGCGTEGKADGISWFHASGDLLQHSDESR
jgi:hypothetical protein